MTSDGIHKLITEYEQVKQHYNQTIVETFHQEDFFNYVENLFTAHSCAIEGNSFSVDETFALKEQGISLKLNNKSLYEAFEILDHFKAYEKAMSQLDQPLSETLIKELHFCLTEHTISYRDRGNPGEYTTLDMMAGDTMFGDHEKNIASVPKLLYQTEQALQKKMGHPVEISATFHKYFIYLHPFRDGNGRLGRLLSNFILAKSGEPLIIITQEQKKDYIDALKASHKHKDMSPIVSFFFKTSIKRMEYEICEKKNLNLNFFLRFKDDTPKIKL